MANRLKEIYEELRKEGVVTMQKDLAQLLDIHHTTLSAAMNGREKTLNPKLIARAEQLLKNIKEGKGSPAWREPAPAAPRQGIVIPPETLELYNNLSRSVLQLSQTVDRLLAGETKKGAV